MTTIQPTCIPVTFSPRTVRREMCPSIHWNSPLPASTEVKDWERREDVGGCRCCSVLDGCEPAALNSLNTSHTGYGRESTWVFVLIFPKKPWDCPFTTYPYFNPKELFFSSFYDDFLNLWMFSRGCNHRCLTYFAVLQSLLWQDFLPLPSWLVFL